MSDVRPLEVLGITEDGELAFRFGDGDVIELNESDLGVLAAEYHRDYLPLWPTRECRDCATDAVCVIEGRDVCEGHALGYGMAEEAS